MLVHHYHRETGAFVGSTEAVPDPLEHAILTRGVLQQRLERKNAGVDLRKWVPLTEKESAPPPPEKFLIPANATTDEPPKVGDGQEAAFVDGAWTVRQIKEGE